MDQLDVNLSELRLALAEQQRAVTPDITPGVSSIDDPGEDDQAIILGESAGQPESASVEPEPARTWFQRLFGV